MVGAILIAFVTVACGGGGQGNAAGRDSERDPATNEETAASKVDRSTAKTTREPVGLDVETVTPGKAYEPAGFVEGSLWATDIVACNDTGSASSSAGSYDSTVNGSAPVSLVACAAPKKTLLKRLDPRTGEEVAEIPLKFFYADSTRVGVGAGSVWVSGAGVETRIDPETNRVVDRIPVDSPTGLAFGHGSVWVSSAQNGTVSRVDPQTGEVAAKIEVGEGAVDIATDESSGDVWVACSYQAEDNKLSRVDPATHRVVAEIPIEAHSQYGGAWRVALGEGAVWAQSVDGRLFKVDPATNEVVAVVPLGGYSNDLAVYGGSVWATAQPSSGTRHYRIDPSTARVVASEDGPEPANGGYRGLVASGGYVWLASGGGLARVAP